MLTKIIPAFVVFALWLDGWFYPLILLPILYVFLVEKKPLESIGLTTRDLWPSTRVALFFFGVDLLIYLPVFFYYKPTFQPVYLFDSYTIFSDVIWYPLYEEIAYRGFLLGHFTSSRDPAFSSKPMLANLIQSILFLSIHHKYLSSGHPLMLMPVFLLGFLNGILFLRTRNTVGCILSHSLLNASALVLNHIIV